MSIADAKYIHVLACWGTRVLRLGSHARVWCWVPEYVDVGVDFLTRGLCTVRVAAELIFR